MNTLNRMRLGFYAILGCFLGLLGMGCGPDEPTAPRLVVALVVDQLHTDLLDRYDALYTGGLRRILDEGYSFSNAVHDHSHTETAAGHATLSTGVLPSRHGIIANNWFENRDGEWTSVYAVEDPDSPIIGEPALEGRSPVNMRQPGLGDWIKAANGSGEVVSLSRKDRSAVTMAGRSRGHVYWLEPTLGRFVTSAYYGEEPADWVNAFNTGPLRDLYADSVWSEAWPDVTRQHARRDTADYEGSGEFTWFPHRFVEESARTDGVGHNLWVAGTPIIDVATLALARSAVETLALGADTVPDLLSVALSQTDIIGHKYGPYSREQLDNLLRLDRELGEFLSFLDRTVGPGNWVLGLSADHGVLPVPEYLRELGIEAGRLDATVREQLRAALGGTMELPEGERVPALSAALERIDEIEAAVPLDRLARNGEAADSFVRLLQNNEFEGRYAGLERFGVAMRMKENFLADGSTGGTTHGSPYYYDRHVPMAFLGAGVTPGRSAESVRTVDFAPTLAALAGVSTPENLDGRAVVVVSR